MKRQASASPKRSASSSSIRAKFCGSVAASMRRRSSEGVSTLASGYNAMVYSRGRFGAAAKGVKVMLDVQAISMAELHQHVGKEVGVSDWVTVTQEMVTKFAEATRDLEWMHIDVERS